MFLVCTRFEARDGVAGSRPRFAKLRRILGRIECIRTQDDYTQHAFQGFSFV